MHDGVCCVECAACQVQEYVCMYMMVSGVWDVWEMCVFGVYGGSVVCMCGVICMCVDVCGGK